MKRNKPSRLERDEEGKPKLTLTPLKMTAVHTPTHQEYDTLMQIYECGGWRWAWRDLPTQCNKWEYDKETCVEAGIDGVCDYPERFDRGTKDYFLSRWREVISTQEFYDIQKITPEHIAEIKRYFARKKKGEGR